MTAPARQPDVSPEAWERLRRHLGTASNVDWETLIQRLESGDSGCIELHVKHGEVNSVRLRDWMLKPEMRH